MSLASWGLTAPWQPNRICKTRRFRLAYYSSNPCIGSILRDVVRAAFSCSSLLFFLGYLSALSCAQFQPACSPLPHLWIAILSPSYVFVACAGDVAADVAMYGQRVLDGRRGRKQPKRKCVDFNSTFLRHLHSRVLFRDYRDLPDMQPSLVSMDMPHFLFLLALVSQPTHLQRRR